MRRRIDHHNIAEADLLVARQEFLRREPRDLFYRAATELIRLAIEDEQATISVSEALGTLLQTWNKSFYRFHGKFDESHFQGLEKVVKQQEEKWKGWRSRSIASIQDEEKNGIADVFRSFENLVGPVGAAKILHLLSPDFFPLWDRKIATAYGVSLRKTGKNAPQYFRFMEITGQQVSKLGNANLPANGTLKLIDEYNYVVITKGWLRRGASGQLEVVDIQS